MVATSPIMANPMMYSEMVDQYNATVMIPYPVNLDTELDYNHSDGRTDFKGNRNTKILSASILLESRSSTQMILGLEILVPSTGTPSKMNSSTTLKSSSKG